MKKNKNGSGKTDDRLAFSHNISPCEINIFEFFFHYYTRHSEGRGLWCSDDFLDMVARATITDPIVSVKGEVFFHELKNTGKIPFLELTPRGIPDGQFIDLSSKRGRKKSRKILGMLAYLLSEKLSGDNILPSDGRVIIIAYVKRWPKVDSSPYVICMVWDDERNAWNIFRDSFDRELAAGTLKLSISREIRDGFRKNTPLEILRGFLFKGKF